MSDANNVDVKFQATTSELEAGAARASQAIQQSLAQMKSGFEGLAASVKGIEEQISGAFGGMQAAIAKFNNVMFAVQNAIQGGSMFKEFVQSSMETTKESLALGKAFGITATEASYMRAAAAQVGVSMEQLQSAGARLTRTLATDEEKLKDLGVATRDTQGHFRNTADIMQDVNARLREFKEGTDRNIEGVKIYGREWANIAPVASKFKGVTEESRREAEALNLVVGVEAVSSMASYKTAQLGVGEVMEGIKNTIGQALMPGLTETANWFKSMGPSAVEATNIAMNGFVSVLAAVKDAVRAVWGLVKDAFGAMGDLIAGCFGSGGKGPTAMDFWRMTLETITVLFVGFRVGVEEACALIRAAFVQLADAGRMLGGVIYAALHGDWAGVKAAWNDWQQDNLKSTKAWMDESVRIAQKGADDIAHALDGSMAKRTTQTAIPEKEDGEHSEGGKDKGKETDRVALWRDGLRQQLEAEENYFKDSTQEELNYWNHILATTTVNEKERIAIHAQTFQLKRKLAQDERATELASLDGAKRVSIEELELKKANLQALKDAQQITEAEYLRRLGVVHQQSVAAELEAVNQKLAIVTEEGRQRQQLLDERSRLEAKANLMIVQDTNATTRAVLKSWQDVLTPMQNSLGQVFDGLIHRTMDARKAMATLGNAILSEFTGLAAKLVMNWAAKEAAQTAATAFGAAERGGIESGAAALSIATWAGVAIKNIMSSAWEAMAGAYKALVGIPYVGPFIAPVAAGAAFAGVAGMASHVASARNGYDIPAGVNPMTQLHEKEMVLPQKQADAVRRMADNPGAGGGNVQVQIKAHPMRGGFMMVHRDDLVKTLKSAGRDFAFQ